VLKASVAMAGTAKKWRSDDQSYPPFVLAQSPSRLINSDGRIAECLALVCLRHHDPNILGLRRVDDDGNGDPQPMIHIAIPLNYRRNQLARALGIEPLAMEQFARRVNLSATEGRSEPLSYIRVPADSLVAHLQRAFEEQPTRPGGSGNETIQSPKEPTAPRHQPGLDVSDQNSWLRSAVVDGLAERNVSIERHRVQILTHRDTGEKWIKIASVDRSLRTPLRLKLKQAGVNAAVTLHDDVEAPDWSIRFAAAEISKLFMRSPDMFDVQTENEALTERIEAAVVTTSGRTTGPAVRLFSPANVDSSSSVPENRRPGALARLCVEGPSAQETRSVC
jgi:hypothetical protein